MGHQRTLRVGEAVLSIGNPLGNGMSVSAGIVSALNRDLQDTPFNNCIQTACVRQSVSPLIATRSTTPNAAAQQRCLLRAN
jgi:S1-C subfamily serine protease